MTRSSLSEMTFASDGHLASPTWRRGGARCDKVPGQMQRANVYIDGFNLFYGALKGRPSLKWLDLAAFGRSLLLPDQELHRVR